MLTEESVRELLRLKGGNLFHRENQELEYKEQFNFNGLADYFKDFAGFANNRGGYLIFGVKDRPRRLVGLSSAAIDQFNRLDPELISGYLLETFSPSINWEYGIFEINGKSYGVFYVQESSVKPVIAKKDEGRNQSIKNGEIYYRYGGRTQKIQFAELENIINGRIKQNNDQWLDLMNKIGRIEPRNAAVLDTEKSIIEKGKSQILVVDQELANKLKFVKEGCFTENKGDPTLKLIGDVVPLDRVEVVKKVRENLLKEYPLSASELANEIKRRNPNIRQNMIWDAIRDTGLKRNVDYSAFNFRNKRQADEYENNGTVPSSTTSLYKLSAVDYLIKVIESMDED